jgi:hypothetical protein
MRFTYSILEAETVAGNYTQPPVRDWILRNRVGCPYAVTNPTREA